MTLPTLSAYRAALDAHDPEAIAAACAPNVVFNSPITAAVRFEGSEEFRELFRSVLEVYDELRCVEEFGDGELRTLRLHARIARGPQRQGQPECERDEDPIGSYRMVVVSHPNGPTSTQMTD